MRVLPGLLPVYTALSIVILLRVSGQRLPPWGVATGVDRQTLRSRPIFLSSIQSAPEDLSELLCFGFEMANFYRRKKSDPTGKALAIERHVQQYAWRILRCYSLKFWIV